MTAGPVTVLTSRRCSDTTVVCVSVYVIVLVELTPVVFGTVVVTYCVPMRDVFSTKGEVLCLGTQ